jgi:hypothetical protein
LCQNIYSIFLGADDGTAARQILIPRDGSMELALTQANYQTVAPSMQMIDIYPNHVADTHATVASSLYLGRTVTGKPAQGTIVFSAIPTVGAHLTIGLTRMTFIANGVVATAPHQIAIGINLSTTVDAILAYLRTQSDDSSIGQCNYSSTNTAAGRTGIVVTAKSVGIMMNAFNLTTTDPSGQVTPMSGGQQPLKFKSGQYLFKKFLPPSRAWQYLYEQWFLFDPSRVPDYRKASVYVGHARLGIPRYTAEIKVAAFRTWKPWYLRAGGFLHGACRPNNTAMVDKVRRAVTAAMAVRDTVRIDTKIRRVIDVNDSLPCDGSFVVGEMTNA